MHQPILSAGGFQDLNCDLKCVKRHTHAHFLCTGALESLCLNSTTQVIYFRPVTQKVDRTKTGPGVQLWQPKLDRARAKARVRAKATARVRARATARAQTMPIHPPLQGFV